MAEGENNDNRCVDPYRLEFFARSPIIARLRPLEPVLAGVSVFLASLSAAVVAAAIAGRFGDVDDLRLGLGDLRRALGSIALGQRPEATPAEFPLLRDTPSVLLLAALGLTTGLVLRQWSEFESSLTRMVSSGALRPRPVPDYSVSPRKAWLGNWRHRVLIAVHRHHVGVGGGSERGDALRALVDVTNAHLGRRRRVFGSAAAAAVMAGVIVAGERIGFVFDVLNPAGSGGDWSRRTYAAWWAGSSSVPGMTVYSVLATVALYVVIQQNLAGFRAVVLVASLPVVAELRMDWLDVDGHFGWEGLRRGYRTVILSLVVHAASVSLLVAVVGFNRGILAVLPLFVLWLTASLAYVVVPLWAVGGVFEENLEERLTLLRAEYPGATSAGASDRADLERDWRRRVQELRACRFNPLLSRRFDRQLLVLSFVLPIVLTLVQVIPSVGGP